MSDSALTLPGGNALVSKHDDSAFDDLAKATEWLPRLTLFGSNSNACKEGKMPIAHYGLVHNKDQITDLGKNVQAYIVAWRPKALLTDGGEGKPVNYFNPESQAFKDIRAKSGIPDSGALVGPEFLVYVVAQGFATFFMASKTARNTAPAVKALMGKGAILSAKLIESGKFKWHGPTVMEASAPFTDQPTPEDLEKVVTAFNNPPESQIEVVTEPGDTSTDRR